MTYKNGIAAPSAPSPAACTDDRMHNAANAKIQEAKNAGRNRRFIPFPASNNTGIARKAFINA